MLPVKKISITLILTAMILVLSILACGGSSTIDSAGDTSQDKSDIIIPAGKLHEYVDDYPKNQDVFVRKQDGSTDTRPNDLEELCKDWLYYRKKIMEAENAGQSNKAAEYRSHFEDVNNWLDEYNQSDVTTMFEILEKQGYSPP